MLDDLRKPFFILALVQIVLAVLIEAGAAQLIGSAARHLPGAQAHADGLGVSSLAVLDSLVLLTVGLMGAALLVPERVQGRVQGVVTLAVALGVLLLSLVLLLAAIEWLTLMLGLLLAPIFGTLAYVVIYGRFGREEAAAVLGLLMLLKLGFAVCLMLAHQRFLENKGLVLIVATSLLAVLLLSFLHGFVPTLLVSITDTLGAIIVSILALVWAVVFLFGALVSIVKALA